MSVSKAGFGSTHILDTLHILLLPFFLSHSSPHIPPLLIFSSLTSTPFTFPLMSSSFFTLLSSPPIPSSYSLPFLPFTPLPNPSSCPFSHSPKSFLFVPSISFLHSPFHTLLPLLYLIHPILSFHICTFSSLVPPIPSCLSKLFPLLLYCPYNIPHSLPFFHSHPPHFSIFPPLFPPSLHSSTTPFCQLSFICSLCRSSSSLPSFIHFSGSRA